MESLLAVREFQNFINEAHLQDMGFVGNSFTWSNMLSGSARILECLDRGLATPAWMIGSFIIFPGLDLPRA